MAALAEVGVPAHDDVTMPVTYHAPQDDAFEMDGRVPSLEQFTSGFDKPAGALWAAPGRVEDGGMVKSTWTDHSVAEGASGSAGWPLVPLRATPGAVVARIDTLVDAERLALRYPAASKPDSVVPGDELTNRFDWAAMREDGIDGVLVSSAGIAAAKQLTYGTDEERDHPIARLAAWEVSSVAWLSTRHVEAGDVVLSGAYPEADDEDGFAAWNPYADPGYGSCDEGVRPSGTPEVPRRFAADVTRHLRAPVPNLEANRARLKQLRDQIAGDAEFLDAANDWLETYDTVGVNVMAEGTGRPAAELKSQAEELRDATRTGQRRVRAATWLAKVTGEEPGSTHAR